MKVGETKDIALTFPENYYEEMAGKDVVFAVTVNSISTYDREKAREELERLPRRLITARWQPN